MTSYVVIKQGKLIYDYMLILTVKIAVENNDDTLTLALETFVEIIPVSLGCYMVPCLKKDRFDPYITARHSSGVC